jgi:hypothetical protein
MKRLLATIALLCLSSTVLYSISVIETGHLCCTGQDCRPVEVTVLPDGSYLEPRQFEVSDLTG